MDQLQNGHFLLVLVIILMVDINGHFINGYW
jgi:hypothetical protein